MTVQAPNPPGAAALPRRTAPTLALAVGAVTRRALLDRRRAVLSWGLSLGALGAFMAAIYPSIQKSLDQVMKNYPSGLKQAFGIESINTVEGYVHAEMFSLIVPLALAYFAVRSVTSAIVGAEERGYLDTTLSLPISRRVLMACTYAVTALVLLAILALMGCLIFVAGRLAGTHISLGLVTAGVLGVWPLTLFFAGIAALASGALHSTRTVTGLALGTVVAMYASDLAGRLAHSLDAIRWISAFRYYGAPIRDGLDLPAFAGLVAAGLLALIVGTWLLERRDVLR